MNEFDLVRLLTERHYHICCAESCTAGLLSATIANVPNASSVLSMSFVTYSPQSKIKLLGVSAETIGRFGLVSPQVAIEMAGGAVESSGAEIGVGITGFAGPSGGDEHACVGTVCFAFKLPWGMRTAKKIWTGTERNELRRMAVDFAVDALCGYLMKKSGAGTASDVE